MNLWSRPFFTDDELVAEIKAYAKARRDLAHQNVAVVAGENRRVEFVNSPTSRRELDTDLREMMAEARRRGLEIGGEPGGALAVEFGHP